MLNKRLLEGASVLVLAGILSLGSALGNAKEQSTNTAVDADSNQSQEATSLYAGTTDYLENLDLNSVAAVTVSVEKEDLEQTTASEPKTLTEEEKFWQTRLIANIGESTLNVRQKASKDADIVGKMTTGNVAKIVKKGDAWTLIKSGNVEGYVSNKYCLFEADAYDYAKENFDTVAKSTVDGLRVRESASADGEVVKKLGKGKSMKVDADAKEVAGWVAVVYDDKTCYVSADYVKVTLNYDTALTVEEIAEIEAAKKAEEAKKADSGKNYRKVNTVQGEGIDYTDDELYLLASLLYREAGGQGYQCQLACGAVIVNRVKDSRFPNNIHDVIYQPGQYGPVWSGSLARAMENGSATQSCYDAARAALSGVDNTGGALGFQGVSCGYDGIEYNGMLFYNIWD